MRAFRGLLAIIGLLIICVAGAMAWLYATQPQPRAAAAWVLGPDLQVPRGELATAVAYAEPCSNPPCPEAERLYVLGGLSGLYRPKNSVMIPGENNGLLDHHCRPDATTLQQQALVKLHRAEISDRRVPALS